jgi:hypothetical protein
MKLIIIGLAVLIILFAIIGRASRRGDSPGAEGGGPDSHDDHGNGDSGGNGGSDGGGD